MLYFALLGAFILLMFLVSRRRRGSVKDGAGAAHAISMLTGMRAEGSPVFPESPKGRRFGRRL